MNFLVHQVVASGGRLSNGLHFVHCYIYDGEQCSCGGSYRGNSPGPELNAVTIMDAADRNTVK